MCPGDRSGHREQFRPDIHQPEQHRLTLFQLGTEADHGVEQGAGQLA